MNLLSLFLPVSSGGDNDNVMISVAPVSWLTDRQACAPRVEHCLRQRLPEETAGWRLAWLPRACAAALGFLCPQNLWWQQTVLVTLETQGRFSPDLRNLILTA